MPEDKGTVLFSSDSLRFFCHSIRPWLFKVTKQLEPSSGNLIKPDEGVVGNKGRQQVCVSFPFFLKNFFPVLLKYSSHIMLY